MYLDILNLIGNTPLVKLKKASEITGCTILGKAEFMNPGGSVKDRAALYIINDAIKKGQIEKNGVVVEGTAGNTGIGLAVVANALGFRTHIVMPNTQSQEKQQAILSLGAKLQLVPPAPYKSDEHFTKIAKQVAAKLSKSEDGGAVWANQFDNIANRDAHIYTTAEEVWAQTNGKVDAFVSTVGSGGTLAGTGIGLKAKNKDIIIALADPCGASLYNYYANGELKSEGNSIAEGIGQGRITDNLKDAPVDDQFMINDEAGLEVIYSLIKDEGLSLGLSSGINIAGAVKLASSLGPGKTIVTMLCDSGFRYQSRLFNPEFLISKGLTPPSWLYQD
jgi:cysteine synthase A